MPELLETFSPLQIALLRRLGTRLLDGYTPREIRVQLQIDESLMTHYLRLMQRKLPNGKDGS